jgi:hypothetical protein
VNNRGEISTGPGPSVGRGHVAEIKRHRRFGASGNRHSRGHEIGKIPGENSDITGAVRSGGTGVGNRDFESLEIARRNRDRPSERTRGRRSVPSAKVPIGSR